ncbi:flagellar export protein FliJ [Lachnospira multipara]|uniref:flagellar export protein FliJ n=1 Tax=Lachnospira multipara TaxID=28051 RepID=UPI0004E17A96|nr:flagellar export protein FliJ [Lachnospira multipara]
MAKFVYKMENVLKVKEQIENTRKQEFSLAQGKLTAEENKLKELKTRLNFYEQELKEATSNKIDVNLLRRLGESIKISREQIKAQIVQVEVAKKNLELAQQRLADAVKERKIQEILKEKAFEEFKLEISAQEMKEIDEVVSFNYNNRSN